MLVDSLKFVLGFICGVLLFLILHASLIRYELRQPVDDIILRLYKEEDITLSVQPLRSKPNHRRSVDFDRLHYQLDNATLANQLHGKIRIACAILLDYRYREKRIIAINDTWGKSCSEIVLFSYRLTTQFMKFSHHKLAISDSFFIKNQRLRLLEILTHFYANYITKCDWFLFATDDNYVIMENLRYFLTNVNSALPVAIGRIDPGDYMVLRHYRKYGRFSFSAVFSPPALKIINSSVDAIRTKCDYAPISGDYFRDLCLEDFGIQSMKGTDKNGYDRFNILLPELWGSHISYRDIQLQEPTSISDFAVSFRHVSPPGMHGMELMTYHLRPFGIIHPHAEVNVDNTDR